MQIRDYYDQYWSENGFNPRSTQLPHEIKTLLSRTVRVGAECLDIGCGDGAKVGTWIRENRIRYLGIDVSENAIRAANQAGLEAKVIDDIAVLPFVDASFDFVTSFEVLEHLLDPMSVAVEVRRVLRPGGAFIATVPNGVEIRRRLEFVRGVWNPNGDNKSLSQPWRDPHIRFFTRKTLKDMLVEAGFSKVVVGHHFDADYPNPTFQRRIANTKVYRLLADQFPGLLATRLHVVAVK